MLSQLPSRDYILGNELVDKMGIHIANISIAKKVLESKGNFSDIIKIGQCTYINRYSKMLPKYIKNAIPLYTYTDFSKSLPLPTVMKEFKLTKEKIFEFASQSHIFTGTFELYDRIFVEFNDKIVDIFNNSTSYVVSFNEFIKLKDINYIELDTNKYLVWY